MYSPNPNFGEPLPGGLSNVQTDKAKKRRWQSRSDEEIAEHMDNHLSYRKGWPQLPPLPVSTIRDGARHLVNNAQAVIEKVQNICNAQRIAPLEIFFAYRVPEVQQAGESYHTLVVAVDLRNDPSLYSLIIQIRKHLQEDPKHREIFIEIIDYRAVIDGLASFAIPPSEEHLMSVWKPVFEIVLEEVHRQKEQWLTIEMLYRGLEDDAARCPATVVITSPSAAREIWNDTLLPSIENRIQVLSPSLEIELLCGSSLHVASEAVPPVPDSQMYEQDVPMGSSIRQRDLKKHSGTAGGMVKLSDGKTYALTNHHVVRNDDLDNREYNNHIYYQTLLTAYDVVFTNMSSDSSEPPFLKPGTPAFDPNKHRFACPSNEDNVAFIQDRESDEQLWLSKSERPGSAEFLASSRAELTMARTTDRSFGRVHASSGLRTVKAEKLSSNPTNGKSVAETGKAQFRFLLDWCLLAFDARRSMTNELPMRRQHNTSPHSTLNSGRDCKQWTVMNNPKCHILRDDVHVGKFGRTTGFTYGRINAIPVVINPEVKGGEYKSVSKTYGLTVENCGHCMEVLPHSGSGSTNVVGSGDSGSIVLHAPSGDWLGLLFGETRAKAALFTPIDLVFRDIEKVTGHQVIEPVFNPKW
ncbi:hypothetical protein N0V83_004251 [Neocucurbitaria cava]|uniref:Uncharacterized protein n=1 Tax=Neocucurbitaria cava TaxID=798079 RepID=A0A9W8YBL2_9PLEO|nr:hypothetical protein N0V83_004251 [Neocucurbitaria cava]